MSETDTITSDRTAVTTPDRWHQTRTLRGGVEVGRLGSLWYFLDENGRPISRGYHEVYATVDGYEGEIGAHRETIEVEVKG